MSQAQTTNVLDAFVAEQAQAKKTRPNALRPVKLAEFIARKVEIEYLIDDLLRRGWLYAMTGGTGSGKTGAAVALSIAVNHGLRFGSYQCNAGPVLYVSAENPEDVSARFAVQLDQMKLRARDDFEVIDQSFLLTERRAELEAIGARLKPTAVIIDTDQAVALRSGNDENSNNERMAHARDLRVITRWPSRPTLIDLCHPAKNFTQDDIVPRGGSAFLNEIDGNLRVWRDGSLVKVSSDPNKFRGAPFELNLEIELIRSDLIRDTKGRQVPVPCLHVISDDEHARAERGQWEEENLLLYVMLHNPKGSMADWARECQWIDDKGVAQKYRVQRLLKRLADAKQPLVIKRRSGIYGLTPKGETEAHKP
jgi:hypothetical protein